ncbi:MAG TPA: ethylbenzene dehydrogenase-related protein [Acidimicrobiia bacterium]
MKRITYLSFILVLALVAGACSDDTSGDSTTTEAPTTTAAATTTEAPTTTAVPPSANRQMDAPAAAISVDGDVSDWEGIDGLDVTLSEIEGETVDSLEANVKVAHDNENVYVLFSVADDYDFVLEDHRFSPAVGVMWAIDPEAGPGMGATNEDQETSLGMVDIWHWELDCVAGEGQGGRVSGPGADNPPGNDAACNFDDEYSTDPENREDDGNGGEAGAENSLLGVFAHSNPVIGEDGTWYFEMSRPLQTGDSHDAQLAVGDTALLGMAYWDPDFGPEGWDDATHVVTSVEGWIDVDFQAGDVATAATMSVQAPIAAITVDGDASDWDGIDGLDMTLTEITGETVESQDATVKVAHDGEFLYMLFAVPDDYDFVLEDHRFSPAVGVMWAIDAGAGPGMGATDDAPHTSLGMVDIWHWELDCAAGEEQGGRVHGAGDGNPLGNDGTCNMDDEYSTDPEAREDDGSADEAGAENSLLGVWTHSNPVEGEDGIWYFEMSRPLQTGDSQDAQFTVGDVALLALAYWDPDFGPEGWDDATHVVSAVEGWIAVSLMRN